jgi:hypothetical protein
MHPDTEVSRLSSHPYPISPLRLSIALFGAPVAWIAQMSLSEPLAAQGCYPHQAPLSAPLWQELFPLLAAISGACLAAGLLAGFMAWRLCRQTGADLMEDREDRSRFLAKLGALSSLIFITAILFTGCAILLVSPCRPWF